ncbi:cold-shock protein [Brucella pituitosa]|uniref:cold-shock protein n=1 Tax=Brucella pituitosa TaxID=571256 RepID=UPI003C76C2BA
MPTGILKIWNDERGFGFLTDDQSPRGADVFVHSTTFKIAHVKPAIGDGFAYATTECQGRRRAEDLRRIWSPTNAS